MARVALCLLFMLSLSYISAKAQDYSSKGLMEIKEETEERRMEWNKTFDEALLSKNFGRLPTVRQSAEAYLDRQILALRKLYAQGDGRRLLTAVNNYLQIQKQFVKDVMVPAESLVPMDEEGIERTNKKIAEFAQKEKVFLIDINNAMATERDTYAPPESDEADEEEDELANQGEMRGSVVEERSNARKGKLPHEKGGRKKRKHRNRDQVEE